MRVNRFFILMDFVEIYYQQYKKNYIDRKRDKFIEINNRSLYQATLKPDKCCRTFVCTRKKIYAKCVLN